MNPAAGAVGASTARSFARSAKRRAAPRGFGGLASGSAPKPSQAPAAGNAGRVLVTRIGAACTSTPRSAGPYPGSLNPWKLVRSQPTTPQATVIPHFPDVTMIRPSYGKRSTIHVDPVRSRMRMGGTGDPRPRRPARKIALRSQRKEGHRRGRTGDVPMDTKHLCSMPTMRTSCDPVRGFATRLGRRGASCSSSSL